jgi:hypothetical protein
MLLRFGLVIPLPKKNPQNFEENKIEKVKGFSRRTPIDSILPKDELLSRSKSLLLL